MMRLTRHSMLLLWAALLAAAAPASADVPWSDAPQALGAPARPEALVRPEAGARPAAAPVRAMLLADDVFGAEPGSEAGSLLWDVGKSFAGLLFVCALAYGSLRFGLPRLLGMRVGGEGRFRIVEKFGLEPKKMLYLMEICGRRVLLASSESGVRFVMQLEEQTARAAEREGAPPFLASPEASHSFYEVLQRKLDRPALERAGAEAPPAVSGAARGEAR
jgi:hypothetical protein